MDFQNTNGLPPRVQKVVSEFSAASRDEQIKLLLEYSQRMPQVPSHLAHLINASDRVQECMTPVNVIAENNEDGMHFYFEIPPESPTVRGLASVLSEGLSGLTAAQVLQVPSDFYFQMGLQKALSPQRLRGFDGIIARMMRLAKAQLEATG